MNEPTNIFEQIGGHEKISQVVELFYQRVMQDSLLAPFFAQSQLEQQKTAQRQFLTMALDGPVERSDFDLHRTHRGRGIRREHLTRFTEHLLAALQTAQVDAGPADQIIARVATYSSQVLGESGGVDG